jgi:hypothetical protein
LAARQPPPIAELRRFAEEHLLYEAGMLYEVTGKLMNRHHRDDLVVENALLESFGIHCRNLIDFLWLEEPMKKTDAIAADYFDGDWDPPEQSERLSKVKGRVGKEIAHLSYNRLTIPEDEKGWLVIGIGPEVIGGFGAFVYGVPDDRVPEGWRERAYATGTVPPEQAKEFEKHIIRAEDLRPEDLPSVPTQGLPPAGHG